MSNNILIDKRNNQTRVAIIEDDDLVEMYVDTDDIKNSVGNIYIGKVCQVLPGMQAAFVDIGASKNAFLYVKDALPEDECEKNKDIDFNISDVVKVGQLVLVQVIKEAIGTKGAKVTRHITLPGRHLILLPNSNYIGISRRIEDEATKNSLLCAVQKVKPDNMGLIIRTIASNDISHDFSDDVKFLLKLWEDILNKSKKGTVPRCVYDDVNLVRRMIRNCFGPSIDKLVVNDMSIYNEVLDFVDLTSPSLKGKVHYNPTDLFGLYSINHSIKNALSKKVWLKCGGYLLIEETETLTVIDVNTGKFVGKNNFEDTILKTNLEAANEIAKQIRLRDIGGIIIIDFIDMDEENHQTALIDAMNEALKKDRTKTTVIGMTKLGLLEMTRKKIRRKLSSIIQDTCPYCEGTGKVTKANC